MGVHSRSWRRREEGHPRVWIATLLRREGESGVQTHFRTLLGWADAAGVPVGLVTAFDAPRSVIWPAHGIGRVVRPVSRAAWVRWYRASHFVVLRRALARRVTGGERVVVYAQDLLSAKAALDVRRRVGAGVEVALAVHSSMGQTDEWVETGDRRRAGGLRRDTIAALEREVLPRVDRLIYTSTEIRREVEARIPEAAAVPAYCLPNFVVRPPAPAPAAPAGDLITIGTIGPRTNPGWLLHVLAAARRLGHRYRLTVVGDGPSRSEMKRLARALGIADLVSFTGYVPHATALIDGHHAYAHVGGAEEVPHAVLEAIASGRPVFAPPVGGIPEAVRDGVEGRHWPLGDAIAAARILIETMEDEAALARMAEAARLRFETTFAPDVVAPRLLAAVLGTTAPEPVPTS